MGETHVCIFWELAYEYLGNPADSNIPVDVDNAAHTCHRIVRPQCLPSESWRPPYFKTTWWYASIDQETTLNNIECSNNIFSSCHKLAYLYASE